MIIVEGPDGAGKTTLVDHIRDEFGLDLGERAARNRDELYKTTRQDTWTALSIETRGDGAPPVVWDRLFYSDFIYAPIGGRKVAFSDAEIRMFHGTRLLLGCPLIVCLPDLEVCIENAAKDHQMDGVNENLTTIWKGYRDMLTQMRGSDAVESSLLFHHDYKQPGSLQRIDRNIKAYINKVRPVRTWKEA